MKLFEKKDTNTNVINIENDDLKDAKLSSIDFKNESVRKRAFINVLGARLGMKMLFSQKIEANNLYSLYTIQNVIEDVDIADIYFQGIKMDVRLVFNRDEIFIPKAQFEKDLLPDLYLVLELQKDFSSAEFLGFFEPKTLNTQNQNKDFYFHEYDRLQSPNNLKIFLDNFVAENNFKIEEGDTQRAQELFLSMADKIISKGDKNFLFKQLANNIELREKIVEFENFEMLSKRIAKNEDMLKDSVLDIVGAQQLYDNEDESKEQIKADVHGEILSDLLDEELMPLEFENENESNSKKSSTGAIVTGLAVGGAIAAGAGAAAAGVAGTAINSQAGLAKSSTDALAASANFAKTLVEAGTNAFAQTENGIEILPESDDFDIQELDDLSENFNQKDEFDFASNEKTDNEFNMQDLEDLSSDTNTKEETDFGFEEHDDSNFEVTDLDDLVKENSEDEIEIESENDLENYTEENIEDTEETSLADSVEDDTLSDSDDKVLEFADIKNNFDNDDNSDLYELPELENFEDLDDNFKNSVEIGDDSEAFGAQEEKNNENVLSLENFDLNTPEEKLEFENNFDDAVSFDEIMENSDIKEQTETELLTDVISVPAFDDDTDETTKKLRELESGEEELNEEVEEPQTNASEDIVSQVDAFLNEVDFSAEQKTLLENTLNEDKIEDSFAENIIGNSNSESEFIFEQETQNTENETVALGDDTLDTEDKEALQVLFNNGKGNDIPELPAEEKKKSSVKMGDKRVLIAASVASVVLIGFVLSNGVLQNNSSKPEFPKNMAATPTPSNNPAAENNSDLTSMNDTTSQNTDIAGGPSQPQTMPSENQQSAATNTDMSKSVSDAFSSEPVNANVTKVAWEVPEDLAYNDSFRKYLQVAGKNLKLNLQNDLLLASEMAYSNKTIVDLQIGTDGSLQAENVAVSSGSKQIDKIVLQSVKQTLQYLKMPTSELNGKSVTATLIINF